VDCEKLRGLASEIERIETALTPENSRTLNSAERSNLGVQLMAVQSQLDSLVDHAQVYARAQPSDKLTIVKALQRMGHVCCMTGDGVNGKTKTEQKIQIIRFTNQIQLFLCLLFRCASS
jgi:hypothetical protein